VTISWDFGDGASATGSPATHAYAAAGDYNVTVTATDGAGNSVHEIHAAHVPAPAAPAPAPAPGSPATIPSGGAQHVFGGLVLKRQTIVVRKRVARVKASCPAATTGGCAGTLRLLSGQKVIGRARFSVAAGGSARIGVKLTRLVAKSRASARAHDGLGATRTTTAKLKLRRG
jgi:hypothetical protein